MSHPWNTRLKQCPNLQYGCNDTFLSEEELSEHLPGCSYGEKAHDVLANSMKGLEERVKRLETVGVESLLRRVELLEIRTRRGKATESADQELGEIRDRLVELEASNQVIREETGRVREQESRVSALSAKVNRLESRGGSGGEGGEADSIQLAVLESKYIELNTAHQETAKEMSELRDLVKKGSLGGRRSYKETTGVSGVEEAMQTQLSELRRKQRNEIRSIEEQMDTLTQTTNNTSMDLRKLRMKLSSEVQGEMSEMKQEMDKIQRTCWTLEGQLEGRGGSKGDRQQGGPVASKEVVNQLLEEMGVFDSARDMDGVSVEFKLLQTKVDLLEETLRELKLKVRNRRDQPQEVEMGVRVSSEEDSVEKLFEEIRKLKTSLAVTNTELQAGFKRTENRVERVELNVHETHDSMEHLRNPNNSKLSRIEQQLSEMESQIGAQVATPVIPVVTYEKQMNALREEMNVRITHEAGDIRRDLEESNELHRDSFDVIQQKCNSLYSECNSLSKKIDQLSRQVTSKALAPTITASNDALVSQLEQGVRELQESYDRRLDESRKQREELNLSVETVWREMEQVQSGVLGLDKQVQGVCGDNGLLRRVEEIEEFLHRDLPSMGVTTSQKATLEKLVEERSDSVKATLTGEIAEQLVEMRRRIPDISDLKEQVEEVKRRSTRTQGSESTGQRAAAERELEEKMEKFKRQVRDLDQNAATIFQSLSTDMQKLTPKLDTSQQERISTLEREISEIREVLKRLAKQELQPRLPTRQPDSLTCSTPDLPSLQSDLPPQPPPKSTLISTRAHYSQTPPIPLPSSLRAPPNSAPSDTYTSELVRRASERCPTSGERIMRITRALKTISDQSTIISDPFFSAYNGYQFRLQACLLPSQSGVKVKVALEILSGNYDEELQWPVEGTIRYYVLNQIHDFAHIHLDDNFFFTLPTPTPIPLKSSFLTVPSTDSSGPYCLNNCIFIRAQILNLSNVC